MVEARGSKEADLVDARRRFLCSGAVLLGMCWTIKHHTCARLFPLLQTSLSLTTDLYDLPATLT